MLKPVLEDTVDNKTKHCYVCGWPIISVSDCSEHYKLFVFDYSITENANNMEDFLRYISAGCWNSFFPQYIITLQG